MDDNELIARFEWLASRIDELESAAVALAGRVSLVEQYAEDIVDLQQRVEALENE